jgi:oligopeptide/dipeptide ABC transporter ATP-binding protein
VPDNQLLEARDVVVAYPVPRSAREVLTRRPRAMVRAVDGITFGVRRGEMLALVGESGSGKTSTANALIGLTHIESGSVLIDGQQVASLRGADLRAMRRKVQVVFQDPYDALDSRFRVRDTLYEPLSIHEKATTAGERETRARDVLEMVGLTPADRYLSRYPHELSGGQRQRVAIAASLMLRPSLLIADEPVSMLDASVRSGVMAVLGSLCSRGIGVLLITHDLATAAHCADRIAVMYLGRIVETGTARDVITSPQHPYTQALLSVVLTRERGHAEPLAVLEGEVPDAARIPGGCRFHPRCPIAQPACSVTDPPARGPGGSGDADSPASHRAACLRAWETPATSQATKSAQRD